MVEQYMTAKTLSIWGERVSRTCGNLQARAWMLYDSMIKQGLVVCGMVGEQEIKQGVVACGMVGEQEAANQTKLLGGSRLTQFKAASI